MTQNERVLDYMKKFGGITQLRASEDLGITRLSARIYDLQSRGIVIYDEWVNVSNRFGEKCRVKEYRLIQREEA